MFLSAFCALIRNGWCIILHLRTTRSLGTALPNSFEWARAIIQTIVSLVVGIWFIVAYGLYKPNSSDPSTSCAKPIPVFLLVMGIVQLVFLGISLIATFCCRIGVKETMKKKEKGGCGTLLMTCLLCLFILFMFSWWIVGQAWTFSIASAQCNDIIWQTSFWYLICVYILIGIGIFVAVVLCFARCCCHDTKVGHLLDADDEDV